MKLDELELKGIPGPLPTYEVRYDVGPRRLPSRTPYVGRSDELSSLLRLGESARLGTGALALIAGEPGIGKTRLAEEVAEAFASSGGLTFWGSCHEGDWSPPFEPFVQILELGHIASAAVSTVNIARAHTALGNLNDARAALAQAWDLVSIVPRGGYLFVQVANAQEEIVATVDEGWDELGAIVSVPMDHPDPAAQVQAVFGGSSERQIFATILAIAARAFARIGRPDAAMDLLAHALPAIRAAPPWTINLAKTLCTAAETIWLTERTEYVEYVEDALREKLIAPDFRYPSVDGRLAMAQMSALMGRTDEAAGWFARAREVLGEMGARPLLAVTDHDEALMHSRRGEVERALLLVDSAIRRFDELGMTGWKRRATALLERLPA